MNSQFRNNVEIIYNSIKNNNDVTELKIFEKEYNIINKISNYVKTSNLEELKNFIKKTSFNLNEDFKIIPYDILLDAIDNNSSYDFIEYCISLYEDLDYCFNLTLSPIYLLVKNNNFEIANKLLQNYDIDINYINFNGGNILSFLLTEFINEQNLQYLIEKFVDINYNLFSNGIKSLSSFSESRKTELAICDFFNSSNKDDITNETVITCFDYIIYEAIFNSKEQLYKLLDHVIECEYFNIDKINTKSIELIIKNKKDKIINKIIQFKYNFISSNFCNSILKYSIIYNNTPCLDLIVDFLLKKINNEKNITMQENQSFNLLFKSIDNAINYIFIYQNLSMLDSLKENIKILNSPTLNNIIENANINKNMYLKNGYNPIHEAYININYDDNNYESGPHGPQINSKETRLLIALKEDNFEVANDILDNTKDINVNIYNENKETPIIILIKNEKLMNCDIFKKLIEKGADLSKKFNGEDPLILAIKKKKIEYIQIILKYSSLDINKLYNGKSIMSILIDNVIDNEEIFNILFKKGGYVENKYISSNCNKYTSLIKKNNGLLKSIINNGIIIKNSKMNEIKKINTPLIYFIKSGKIGIVEKLLENGASTEEIDEEGFTPIFHTIKGGRLNLFNILLNKYHADITKKNNNGQTPLIYTRQLDKNKYQNLNLFISILEEYMEKEFKSALTQKNIKMLKNILNNEEFDVNKTYNKKTVMNYLIENKIDNEEIYNIMFKRKTWIDSKYTGNNKDSCPSLIENNIGLIKSIVKNGFYIKNINEFIHVKTPVIHFIKNCKYGIAEKLLENGASINEMDEDGFTPLIHLMKTSNTIVFKLLLDKYHPNVNQKNKLGQTPLSFAQQLDRNKYIYTEIYILLLKNYIKTKLLLALKEGDFKTANDYLNNTKDINVNIYNENKETPIIILIKNEKLMNCDIFKKLIEKGADLSKKFNGEDPLILAIKKKKIEYIQIILKYSSLDINKLYNGKSIMSILIDNVIENEEIFNILFKKGGYIDFTYIMNTRPKLNALIEKNSGLIKSIIQNGLITKKGRNSSIIVNKSPLSFFIKAGKNKLVEKFLENGASVEEIDEEGFTPIFHTIKGGRLNLFNILLNKYHADITKKNNNGQTPLIYTRQLDKNKYQNLNLFISILEEYMEKEFKSALTQKNIKMLKNILNNEEFDVNKTYNKKTVMNYLIENKIDNEEIYNIMFKRKTWIDSKYTGNNKDSCPSLIENNIGLIKSIVKNGFYIKNINEFIHVKTPVIHFIKNCKYGIAEKLLENGASINEMDEDGFTPLIHLMKTSNTIVFKLLLDKYHPNVNQKNKLGQTPLSFAQQLDRNKYIYTEIYILLLKNYIKTKLLLALKEGDFKTANDYLNNTKDINVNIYNENKETPIIILIKNEKLMNCDIFKKLIEKGADLSKKFNGEDPLILAIKKKKIEYIQIILKYSSLDINKLYNGKSIMSILIDNVIENEEIFNILFKKGGYIDFTYIMNTRPKLNALIEKNSGLIKSIIQNGLITKKGRNSSIIVNKSPLSFFIKAGKNKLVEKFLENGASVEEIDEEGFTPIFHTIKGVRLNLFNILLNKYHANITRKNKEGLTPLSFAQYYEKKKNINLNQFIKALENKLKQSNNKNNSHSKTNYTDLLINAIKQGNYKKSKNILDNNKKINVNLEDTNHETPLITLFTNKQEENCEILKELIEHGADLFKIYKEKYPIFIAIQKKKYKYIEYIIKHSTFIKEMKKICPSKIDLLQKELISHLKSDTKNESLERTIQLLSTPLTSNNNNIQKNGSQPTTPKTTILTTTTTNNTTNTIDITDAMDTMEIPSKIDVIKSISSLNINDITGTGRINKKLKKKKENLLIQEKPVFLNEVIDNKEDIDYYLNNSTMNNSDEKAIILTDEKWDKEGEEEYSTMIKEITEKYNIFEDEDEDEDEDEGKEDISFMINKNIYN